MSNSKLDMSLQENRASTPENKLNEVKNPNLTSSQSFENDLGRQLGQSKKQRKQMAIRAQLLANRIALLKQEELKSWKKIQDTQKKTEEIFVLKKRTIKISKVDGISLPNAIQNQLNPTTTSQMLLQEQRKNQKNEIQKFKNKLMMNKKQQAEYLREIQEKNLKRYQNQLKLDYTEKRIKHEQIKKQLDKIQLKIQAKQKRKQEKIKQQYHFEIELEDAFMQKKEMEIQKMEQLELELIKKLQNTQSVQKKAFEELEAVLKLQAEEFQDQYRKKRAQTQHASKKANSESQHDLITEEDHENRTRAISTHRKKFTLPKIKKKNNKSELKDFVF